MKESVVFTAPLISVVIPTCHRNGSLALCLECLAPGVQTLPISSYEVIVTDDGVDGTAEQMIQTNYPWVKWIAGPRRGPAANRNNGAAVARGRLLVFTDDDCLPTNVWLDAFVHSCVGVGVLEGRTVADRPRGRLDEESPLNHGGGFLWSCNFAITRRLFLNIGGFDEGFPFPAIEDVDLRERLRKAGEIIRFVPNAEIVHPWRPTKGICFRIQEHQSWLYFVRKHPELAPRCLACHYGFRALRTLLRVTLPGFVRFRGRGFVSALLVDGFYAYLCIRALVGTSEPGKVNP